MTIGSPGRPEIDVAILGAGIAGTALATVLARHGAKVMIFDAGSHPRFAIGESTVPYTSTLIRLVAHRYDVPELKMISTFHNVQAHITRNGGLKKGFGFLYHRPGEQQVPEESNEAAIPSATHSESHFFRQDLDAWLLNLAVKYGAQVRQETPIADVDFDDDGVTVIGADQTRWRARFVVDASGFRSPVATRLDLRETPSRLRHHARSIFTHMIDVPPYEELVPAGTYQNYNKWSTGTLHHIFKGGWLWVIPFNNHARARNPLVSVGLQLDPRVHPKVDGLSPEQEFRQFIADYPGIAKQFKKARAAREWVSTGRMQYSPKQTIGYRWCLTSHAAGFIDPLFSRGMSNTFEIINALTWRLLDALREDDFSVERFEPVQHLEQSQLDFNDNLVANAYTSFADYDLWNAWFRMWLLGQSLGSLQIGYVYAKVYQKRDVEEELAAMERLAPEGGIPDYKPLRRMYGEVSRIVRDVADGRREHAEAAKQIFSLLSEVDFIPPSGLKMADPDERHFGFSFTEARSAMQWAKTEAPERLGKMYKEMPFYIKLRFDSREFNPVEEIKAALAERKIGKRLRVPDPS